MFNYRLFCPGKGNLLLVVAILLLLCSNACETANSVEDSDTDDENGADGDADTDADTDGDTDADSDSDGDTDSECGETEVTFDIVTPTVDLLIDQSGSMNFNFDGEDRWVVVGEVLFDPANGVVKQLESDVRFGMTLYTSDDGFEGGPCPITTSVPPAMDNYDEIAAVFNANEPDGDTPTGASVRVSAEQLIADAEAQRRVIVLATDGEPDTCEDSGDEDMGRVQAVAAVKEAFANGVTLYMISVGADIGDEHMQDMANAGQGVQPGEPDAAYYQANDTQQLIDAFEEIIDGVRDCVLSLNSAVVENLVHTCVVLIDGNEVPFNDPNGWQLNTPTEIELLGQACEAIQEGQVTVDISCDCEAVVE